MMSESIAGACLCGAVAFTVDNAFEKMYLCSCSQCRQITGSAYASNLQMPSHSLFWMRGEELVQRFKLPGRNISKAFCPHCGSGLPYISEDGSRVTIPAGVLQTSFNVDAMYRIFDVERPDWSKVFEDIEAYSAFPEPITCSGLQRQMTNTGPGEE